MADCKYGDPTCPCQDGDMCHYKAGWATPAMPVPTEYVDAVIAKKDAEIERLRGEVEMYSSMAADNKEAYEELKAETSEKGDSHEL